MSTAKLQSIRRHIALVWVWLSVFVYAGSWGAQLFYITTEIPEGFITLTMVVFGFYFAKDLLTKKA
jgi:hypothetical protein